MPFIVMTAVAQVDATDVGSVEMRPARMTDHDQLLMVRAARPHPHIEQATTSGPVDLFPEMAVFRLGEPESVEVRTPYEAAHENASGCCLGEDIGHLATRAVEELVRVAAPVGEEQEVSFDHPVHGRQQLGEVGTAVYQGTH